MHFSHNDFRLYFKEKREIAGSRANYELCNLEVLNLLEVIFINCQIKIADETRFFQIIDRVIASIIMSCNNNNDIIIARQYLKLIMYNILASNNVTSMTRLSSYGFCNLLKIVETPLMIKDINKRFVTKKEK